MKKKQNKKASGKPAFFQKKERKILESIHFETEDVIVSDTPFHGLEIVHKGKRIL